MATVKANTTLVIKPAIGASYDLTFGGITQYGRTSGDTIGVFPNDKEYTLVKHGTVDVYSIDRYGTKSYEVADLPASLPAGTSLVVDGVMVESTGTRFIRSNIKDGKPRLITGRNVLPDMASSPTQTTRCWRSWKPFLANCDVNGVVMTWGNWFVAQNGVETDNTSTVTLQASIEKDGIAYPVFFNGKRQIVMAPGDTVTCDTVPVTIKHGIDAGFYVRTWCSVASTSEKMLSSYTQSSLSSKGSNTGRWEGVAASYTDDMTQVTPNTAVTEYSPFIIRGFSADGGVIPSMVVFGSSSAQGVGDELQAPEFVPGYIARSLIAAKIPYVMLAESGETAESFLGTSGAKRRYLAALCNATHSINTYGSNDISSGATLSQCQARLRRMKQLMDGFGTTPFFGTYTPSTTSTDSWATVANQTVSSTIRHQLSDWLRQESEFNIIDLEAVSDSGLSSGSTYTGKWRVDLGQPTTDGTHGAAVMHTAIAASITYPSIKF